MERLAEIIEFIKNSHLELANNNDDGRINSVLNEEQITDIIIPKFSYIEKPPIRKWYDIAIKGNIEETIYVNIKVSDFCNGASANISSKLGMGHALTGIIDLPTSWKAFNKLVAENIRIGYDYYFIIIDKNNINNSYWTSLKRIDKLVSNGNNLPFQCNWSKNRIFSNRTETEAMEYILKTYINSWDKKTDGYPHELKRMLDSGDIIV